MQGARNIGILLAAAGLFGGCFTQFALDPEDVRELEVTPDQKVAFFLVDDGVLDARPFQYIRGTDSTNGILGRGTRTLPLRAEETEFREFLPLAKMDSLSLREGWYRCRLYDGSLVSIREENALRVTPSGHAGYWVVGATQRRQPGGLFRGFLPDSTIAEVKADRISLLGTVVGLAVLAGVVVMVALGEGGFF